MNIIEENQETVNEEGIYITEIEDNNEVDNTKIENDEKDNVMNEAEEKNLGKGTMKMEYHDQSKESEERDQ